MVKKLEKIEEIVKVMDSRTSKKPIITVGKL